MPGALLHFERAGFEAATIDQPSAAAEALLVTLQPSDREPDRLTGRVLDPTGTPVAGGASSDKLLQILRGLSGVNLVAADVMEVAPAYDHAEITSLAAATAGLELLYLRAAVTGPE